MGRRGPAPKPVPYACPQVEHAGSEVRSRGERTRADGTKMLRFVCLPLGGKRHWFEIDASHDSTHFIAPQRCPDHPEAKVVRNGRYSSSGHPRQRYRCYPEGERSHIFTPVVPRQQVDHGEHCRTCSEERSIHAGDATAGRGHHYTAHQVARGLIALSRGDSYASVGATARDERWRQGEVRRAELNKKRRAAGQPLLSALPRRDDHSSAWRLAASWCETFTPLLWDPWDQACRKETEERGQEKGTLRIVAVDDKPYYGAVRSAGGRQEMMFAVLIASEIELDGSGELRSNRIRLIKFLPDRSEYGYTLLFHDLGYDPDVVLSDGGTGITAALTRMAKRTGHQPRRVMSSYHIVRQLNAAFVKMAKATPPFVCPSHLLAELDEYMPLVSTAAWEAWWQRLEDAWNAQGIPKDRRMPTWQKTKLPIVSDSLALMETYPGLPRSTGNIESVVTSTIEPMLGIRAERLGNLARSNALGCLVTLRLNGQLSDPAAVAETLRMDARKHKGYAPPTRQVQDPGTYRSLLDASLTRVLVENLGI